MSPQVDASPARKPASRPQAEAVAAARAGGAFDVGLLLTFLGLTFLLGVFPVKDTDLWWHLKAGDMIRQAGWVPSVDTLTFGAAGHRWVDLHWIFQLLISFGFERGGVAGLNVAKCGITCLAVGLLVTSGRREWPTWATLSAWVLPLLVLSGRMYVRPETLTLLYMAADVAILARWSRRPWLAFGLPVVQVAWVNTQGLFVFGPFLVGVALLDAATRRGAFAPDRRRWWRTALIASGLTGLACVLNPYGLAGAVYPIELLGTMGTPVFRESIGELKPIATLFAEVGFDLLPLQLHMATMALGALSFLIPGIWRVATRLRDRRTPDSRPTPDPAPKTSKKIKPGRAKHVAAANVRGVVAVDDPGILGFWFRAIIYLTFSALSFQATRNSHQFAAMVGTVTGWNFAEWAAQVAARRRRLAATPGRTRPGLFPRAATLAVLVLALLAVGSGRFYDWSGEGRTVGIGEEPLWFPHAATRFAGGPNMPDRLVGFHNGHAALYEYEWGPRKQVYTDARLEVMGPDLYREYLSLQGKLSRNTGNWSAELAGMGHPAVLVDTVDPTNGGMVASLLGDRRWHCVWFDPVAAVFVDDQYPAVTREHEVDFLARHYGNEADREAPDLPTTFATARALRGVATSLSYARSVEANSKARALIALGLDYARRLRVLDPDHADGFKQAGLLHFLLDPLPADRAIPRFRIGFDPAIDLSLVAAAYELRRCLELAPDEGICLFYLALLDQMRGMDEAAIPVYTRFAEQPNKNLVQQQQKKQALDTIAELKRSLGPVPVTTWNNLSELEQVFDRLCASGRAETAAEVGEKAHRDDARPWSWADRLATIRLHLGQPDQARRIWRAAVDAPAAVREARVAATYLVEGDFDLARKGFIAAQAADPGLFEAHYGLARLEQAAGRADAAVDTARRAERAAADDRGRNLARQIINEANPYRRLPRDSATP